MCSPEGRKGEDADSCVDVEFSFRRGYVTLEDRCWMSGSLFDLFDELAQFISFTILARLNTCVRKVEVSSI